MKTLLTHLRRHVIRGILAIIPLALTIFAVMLLYNMVDRKVTRLVEQLIGFSFPGMGIIITVSILYLIGLTASNVLGKQIFSLIEKVTDRIPLVKTTYKVGRQLSSTLSLPEGQVFKRAVLVNYLKPGIWTIGFVTGTIIDRTNNNETLLKVFIPTPPNPTSGTMVLVRESETRDPGWSIEEALQAVVSGGIIGPTEIQ